MYVCVFVALCEYSVYVCVFVSLCEYSMCMFVCL